MSEAEARRAARWEFGGLEQVKEECRDARSFWFLDSLLQDVRYACRGMRRSPGFTTAAVMTLALGIGIDAAVFTSANTILFKGPPSIYRNDRLLYINSRKNGGGCCASWPDFQDWRAQARSFGEMAFVKGAWISLGDKSGLLERIGATRVSTDIFRLLGQRPVIGRDFVSSDETPGAAPVAILTYNIWERRYGKDPAIVGQTIRIDGAPTTVIGVMARGFSFPWMQELWTPLVPTPDIRKRENRDALWFAIGRMADGVTVKSARTEMETIGKRLASAWPLTNQGVVPVVTNYHGFAMGPNATMIYGSLWGAVGFVLLIACANVANLLLARATVRSREISIRIALGAGRGRIIRQLLIESLVLSGLGGIFGGWIAQWGVRAYALVAVPDWKQSWFDFTPDYRVVGYLIAISMGTGILFGLAPALRLSKPDLNNVLKDGGHGAAGGGRGKHLSALLVTGEMALAVVLLTGAGVMIRSFLNIYTANVGVNAANILTAYVALPDAGYPGPEARISFFDRLKTRLEAIPGVESIAIANFLPAQPVLKLPYELAGAPPADAQHRPALSALIVGPAYFRILGATVLSGREFDDADGISGVQAIVNQRFASMYWPGENPLGKRLRVFDGKAPSNRKQDWLSIVGVVSNIVQNDRTRQEIDPLVYLPYRQKPVEGMNVMARTRVPPGNLATPFWREIQATEPNLAGFGGPSTLTESLDSGYRDNGINGALLLIFAAIALLLASVGLYAVMAHSVSRRTREIGIRMAVGATAREILKLVFGQGMLPVGIGLTIGLAASFVVNRVLKSQLAGVSPADPITLAIASATLILAAMLGCLIPARRAMRVDPASAIRHE